MGNLFWYGIWGFLYLACGILGFLSDVQGALRVLLVMLALACFVPPTVLLYRGNAAGNRKLIRLVRNVSALSLAATLVMMMLNISLAFGASETTAKWLNGVLVMVSSPMYCMGNGLVSLFLWAFLLMLGIRCSRKKTRK